VKRPTLRPAAVSAELVDPAAATRTLEPQEGQTTSAGAGGTTSMGLRQCGPAK
jgi:hypothetical protein